MLCPGQTPYDYLCFGEEAGEEFGLMRIETKYHIAPVKLRHLGLVHKSVNHHWCPKSGFNCVLSCVIIFVVLY